MPRIMIATLVMTLAACGAGTEVEIDPGDDGEYEVVLDPESFVALVDNPLSPLIPGSSWVYESVGGDEVETIEVVVLDETRMVMGIPATVVRDTVTVDGEIVEDTYDWFAQDDAGNVWYLGEDTNEFEGGVAISSAGSWEAGVDGALPGIVMKSSPNVGDVYRQEFYPGEAEDLAEVVREGMTETVAFGSYDELAVIKEWNPLAPEVVEEKYYAAGVGLILEVAVRGGDDRIELVSFQPGG
jgi:hypothetical protein